MNPQRVFNYLPVNRQPQFLDLGMGVFEQRGVFGVSFHPRTE